MVLRTVVSQIVRRYVLDTKPRLVDEADAALPVAACHVARNLAVEIILTAHEIPEEIAEIHVVQLVVEEQAEIVLVIRHLVGLPLAVRHAHLAGLELAVGVCVIERLVSGALGAPHAREDGLGSSGIFALQRAVCLNVFVTEFGVVCAFLSLDDRCVLLAVDDGGRAELLTAEIAD